MLIRTFKDLKNLQMFIKANLQIAKSFINKNNPKIFLLNKKKLINKHQIIKNQGR